jgi:hypothetical protein
VSRWEIVTDHPHEAARYGYGNDQYELTLAHLRKRGDRKAAVRHGNDGPWRTVRLNKNKPTSLRSPW